MHAWTAHCAIAPQNDGWLLFYGTMAQWPAQACYDEVTSLVTKQSIKDVFMKKIVFVYFLNDGLTNDKLLCNNIYNST